MPIPSRIVLKGLLRGTATRMPVDSVPGSVLRRVNGVPCECYILENVPLENLLFSRSLMGLDFAQACKQATRYFLEHFARDMMPVEGISELMLLSKGYYYRMYGGFEAVFQRNLPINFVATQRVEISGDSAEVQIPYANLDAAGDRLLIGDTVASGATICAALQHVMSRCAVREVFIFSIAAAEVGIRRIAEFCNVNGIRCHIGVGLALFGLGENGFDLTFLHPQTITASKYRERAEIVYQGLPISVVGWDFGSQSQAPTKYRQLCWIEALRWGPSAERVFVEREPPENWWRIEKERDAYRYLPPASDLEGPG